MKNMLDLCSGIGGFSLAARWAGMQTVAFAEIDPFCAKVLRKHWPETPNFGDVRNVTTFTLARHGIERVDVITAGYPCQPYSQAGKRRGGEDDRAIWPEIARIIADIKPRWFIGENVPGHVSLGLDDVLADLESLNYEAWPIVFPAAAVGTPHIRDRVFIVAYTDSDRHERHKEDGWQAQRRPEHAGIMVNATGARLQDGKQRGIYSHEAETGSGLVAEPERSGTRSTKSDVGRANDGLSTRMDRYLSERIACAQWPARPDMDQFDYEAPRVVIEKLPNRAARIKSLGNAVVPQQVYPILAGIAEIEAMAEHEQKEAA